jgi:predicted membrane channel-forming protein YqfA (hemolysin III family)
MVGIRSLITWLSDKGITLLFCGSLMVFAVSTIGMIRHDFSLLTILLLLVPGIVTGLLFRHAKRNFSDILYYFILDGLMALSAVLTGFQCSNIQNISNTVNDNPRIAIFSFL